MKDVAPASARSPYEPPPTTINVETHTHADVLRRLEACDVAFDGETPAQRLARKLEEERIKRELEEYIRRTLAFAKDFDLDPSEVAAKVPFRLSPPGASRSAPSQF